MPAMADTHETLLNGALARGLKARGLDAEAEREYIDVLVNVGGLRVTIEAKNGQRATNKRDAKEHADRRIAEGRAERAIALCYPDGATEDSLAGDDLLWAVREDVKGKAKWHRGDMDALAATLRVMPQAAGDADDAAARLSKALDAAVDRMSAETQQALADRLGIRHKDSRKAAKRGMLVVATSMLFHHRLQGHLPRPDNWVGDWPPPSARTCATLDADAHRRAWEAILRVDYKPVFETAIAALDALPIDAGTTAMLRQLADSVSGIAAETVGLRHDLLGRIFHRVLDTARQDGSFYTSTAAAALLAALAIRETDVADAGAIANLRICDPACGTGTLLMAAYERIYQLKQPADEEAEALLAQLMVEDVLWGYDINLTATHMTASTLGMMSPKTQFDRMNVHRAKLGVFEDGPSIGSLELLGGHMRLESRPSIEQVDAPGEEAANPPPMDLVIMNPPFTRQDLRHDQFTDGDNKSSELAVKAREKAVLRSSAYRGAARLHSSGGMFAVMGTQMIKEALPDAPGGTLAMILPTIAATSPGNADLRKFAAEHLHIDTIVTSHDPERIFFSENTSIGEMLVICRRDGGGATRVINLSHNPATPTEALRLLNELDSGETSMGTIQQVPRERIRAGDWYAVNFFSPALTAAFRELREWTVPISEIAEIRSAGRLLSIYYDRTDNPTVDAKRAIYYHKTGVTQSMRALTDSYIEPKPGKEKAAEQMWSERSRLLIADRLRLNLARASSVMLDNPAQGGSWTATKPKDGKRATAAAICAWLNSSVGLMGMLAERDNRVPSYPKFQTTTLRALRVPDFREHTKARNALAKVYDRRKDATLAPFPQMADDPVRRKLDNAVCAALSLDPEWVARVRNELAREPSVTGKQYG